jgi:hypothetical protein
METESAALPTLISTLPGALGGEKTSLVGMSQVRCAKPSTPLTPLRTVRHSRGGVRSSTCAPSVCRRRTSSRRQPWRTLL